MVGLVNKFMDRLEANQFFRTIAAAFPMALLAYVLAGMVNQLIQHLKNKQ